MRELMERALNDMSAMQKLYLPAGVKCALLAYGQELDRLRAEVNELRSKIEKE